jgi:predicted DCC family thiol-disulfide oxidoreductase YuxK
VAEHEPPTRTTTRVAEPPSGRPVLVFDGDCGFCRWWIARWRRATAGKVEYAPYQEAAARFPEIPLEAFRRSVQLVEPDGRVTSGAEAVFRALAAAPGRGGPLWIYRQAPGAASAAEAFYRLVAANRPAFSKLTRWLWGAQLGPPEFFIARRALILCLAITYLIAFGSLWVQIGGLVGEDGILPAAPFLEAVRAQTGAGRYWTLPTIAWWTGASEAALEGICAAGVAVALALAAGLAPPASLLVLWALYLSLMTVCRVFLRFQWDILLLEAGLLAIFLAPLRWRFDARRERPPSRVALFLARFLLFRLMLGSGIVKLASGDPVWWDLSALTVHYETQPLPTWTSWYVHQLPAWFHVASCAGMFAVELAVPFLILGPRRPRILAFWALVGLQATIAATGNYNFFNLLSAALCLPLLDDASWPGFIRRRFGGRDGGGGGEEGAAPPRAARRCPLWAGVPVAAAAVIVGASVQAARAGWVRLQGGPVAALYGVISPFHSLNPYGLFADMTTERPEIVVEGSDDGTTWKPYEFRWKPGDPTRRPGFVQPHQPRLDWQMWFAALSTCRRTPWFVEFLGRLLQGSPEVLALLDHNPFPDRPPRQVRALLYEYRFTDLATRRATGAWWRRELKGLYCPVLTRRE